MVQSFFHFLNFKYKKHKAKIYGWDTLVARSAPVWLLEIRSDLEVATLLPVPWHRIWVPPREPGQGRAKNRGLLHEVQPGSSNSYFAHLLPSRVSWCQQWWLKTARTSSWWLNRWRSASTSRKSTRICLDCCRRILIRDSLCADFASTRMQELSR